jgi:phytoene dehydrogenase-like protein
MKATGQASEVIVIGAGLGGLCTAALLARAGRRVRVLDRASQPGGMARSRTERGYVHNSGAHALYLGGPALSVLRSLGIAPRGGRPRGEGGYLVQGDALRALPRGPWTMLTTDALDLRGKLQLGRVLGALGARMAERARGQSVRAWLDAEVGDPRARDVLEAFVRLATYCHAPELLGADVALRQLEGAVRRGVMYVDGGWQTLVDAAAGRARELGVQVELDSGAARIEYAEHAGGAHVVAVHAQDGRRLAASHVVAAVDPHALAALIPDDAHAREHARGCVPLRAACLDLGVRALPAPGRAFAMATDAPLYFADHSACAALAPAGAHTLHVVRYLGPGEDGRGAEPELRAFLERVQPGACDAAEALRFLPNLTVHHDIPGSGRAAPAHPRIAGLYRVGDHAGGSNMLLDGVLDSAREVAERVQARDADRAA